MVVQHDSRLVSLYKSTSKYVSLFVAGVGILALIGWILDIQAMKSVVPGLATMKVNAAITFILSGIALRLANTEKPARASRSIMQACAALVALIGLLTLGEYAFGWNLGIDQLILKDLQTPPASFPGRMSVTTALNACLLGLAFLLLDYKLGGMDYLPAQPLVFISGSIAALGLIGYMYDVKALYYAGPYSTFGAHTALNILLAIGVLLARPERGFMSLLSSNTVGGRTVRRLLPLAIGVPILLGGLELTFPLTGPFNHNFAEAIFASTVAILLGSTIWMTSRWLNGADLQRRQAEEALRESHEQFEKTFFSSPVGMLIVRLPEGQIVNANNAFLEMTGCRRDEVIGKNSRTLRLVISPEAGEKSIAALFHNEGTREREIEFRRISGEHGYALASAETMEFAGEPHIVITMNDITERKRAEFALIESEKRYRTLFDNVPIGLGVANFRGKLLDYNKMMLKIGGYTTENISKIKNITELYAAPNARNELLKIVEKQGYADRYEARFRRRDGALFDALLSLRVVKLNGERSNLVMIEDVTEQKKRQQEREVLLALATALRAASNRAEMIPIILDQIMALIELDGAALATLDPSSGEAIIELARGGLEPWNNLRIPPSQGITGMVIASGNTYVTNDLNSDPNNYRSELVDGLISVACAPLIADQKTIGALWIKGNSHMDNGDVRLLEGIANMAATAIYRATLFEQTMQYANELASAYEANIEGWSRALDLRDKETEGHTQRVTDLTLKLARAMGIPEAEQVHIRRGALLHDIGKMGVPDHILLKPDKLTDEEYEIIKKHPAYAYELLSPIAFLKPALDIPYCHHERWNGTGYPRGLKGEEIPIAARLFAIVDVWDALLSDRPYRKGWPKDKVREYIRTLAGTHFDPKIVEVFLSKIKEASG